MDEAIIESIPINNLGIDDWNIIEKNFNQCFLPNYEFIKENFVNFDLILLKEKVNNKIIFLLILNKKKLFSLEGIFKKNTSFFSSDFFNNLKLSKKTKYLFFLKNFLNKRYLFGASFSTDYLTNNLLNDFALIGEFNSISVSFLLDDKNFLANLGRSKTYYNKYKALNYKLIEFRKSQLSKNTVINLIYKEKKKKKLNFFINKKKINSLFDNINYEIYIGFNTNNNPENIFVLEVRKKINKLLISTKNLNKSASFIFYLIECANLTLNKKKIFDFEGSLIPNVSNMYRRFNAKPVNYLNIYSGRYCFIFILIKFIKKIFFDK